MTQIIYADILVVVNIYVTYFLLRLTGVITSSDLKIKRIVIASILGGFYSLILLIPNVTDFAIVLTRPLMSLVLIFFSYKVINFRHFLKLIISFFAVNFAFAGLIFALLFCFNPTSLLYSAGIVYFNIDTVTLLVLTVIFYLIFLVLHRLLKFNTPTNLLYEMTIFVNNKSYICKAFLDTGNNVIEPFSAMPVIVVCSDVFLYEDVEVLKDIKTSSFLGKTLRYIPCKGVSNINLLPSFKADKIRIKGINIDFYTDRVYIAITNNKLKNGEFEALLNSRVFENKTNEKGEDYETNNCAAFI